MGPTVVLCFVLVTGLALVTAAAPNDGSVQVAASIDGIGVFPLSEQTWRSRVICHPDKTTEAPRVWIGEEFFALEYGDPCDFSRRDFVADYGYCGNGEYRIEDGKPTFRTGREGFFFGFGGLPGELQRPGNRFGVCWGPHLKERYRLRLVLTQDVPRTNWTFSLVETRRKRPQKQFVLEGVGRQVFEIDLGFVRVLQPRLPILGIQFECSTPNASIGIESIKIAPSSANVYFRKRFTLTAKPVLAHATFQVFPVYDLYEGLRGHTYAIAFSSSAEILFTSVATASSSARAAATRSRPRVKPLTDTPNSRASSVRDC